MVTLTVVLRFVFLLGLVALATGCGKGAMEPPKVAPRGDQQTQAPRRLEVPRPRLLAPPPAYGNKIVMAKARARFVVN
jgi:hypothetical protein